MNDTGGDNYLVNEPAPPAVHIYMCISWLNNMHKAIYCVCILYEHSAKSEELLYAFSLYIGAPGADSLGVLGV